MAFFADERFVIDDVSHVDDDEGHLQAVSVRTVTAKEAIDIRYDDDIVDDDNEGQTKVLPIPTVGDTVTEKHETDGRLTSDTIPAVLHAHELQTTMSHTGIRTIVEFLDQEFYDQYNGQRPSTAAMTDLQLQSIAEDTADE